MQCIRVSFFAAAQNDTGRLQDNTGEPIFLLSSDVLIEQMVGSIHDNPHPHATCTSQQLVGRTDMHLYLILPEKRDIIRT